MSPAATAPPLKMDLDLPTGDEPVEEVLEPKKRCAGVLVHPTSLPSPYGIGDIGKPTLDFLVWLNKGGQSLWQFLPLNPPDHGGSPYSTPSAMAANPILIALEPLVEVGLLQQSELADLQKADKPRVDYPTLTPIKRRLLRLARDRFRSPTTLQNPTLQTWKTRITEFVAAEGPHWLNDYVLFTALHERENKSWVDWPHPLRDRDPTALQQARTELSTEIDSHIFNQYIFAEQWALVRQRAKELNVRLVGDIPIFVAHDSSDVWSHRHLFKLDPTTGRQMVLSGVPPDYFSETGQLWGNPLYDWDACEKEGYAWWTLRFRRTLAQCDVIRIDHFRGFEAAWEVPAGEKTAINGTWVKGPGAKVFRAVDKVLGGEVPIIAEDLGLITPEVNALRDELGYPGMKVLQFAWAGGPKGSYGAGSDHLPHNLTTQRSVLYTGTHDSDTVRGWAENASPSERRAVRKYLGRSKPHDDSAPGGKRKRTTRSALKASSETTTKVEEEDQALDVVESASWDFIRLAYASISDMAIIQLQDPLDLGGDARMNLPGTTDGNWSWRVEGNLVTDEVAERLRDLAELYGR